MTSFFIIVAFLAHDIGKSTHAQKDYVKHHFLFQNLKNVSKIFMINLEFHVKISV